MNAQSPQAENLRDLLIFDAHEVTARLERADLKSILRKTFKDLADGRVTQPPQSVTLLPEAGGDYIVYSAALAEPALFGVKVSPYLSALSKAGEIPVTAYTILFSSTTGRPVALCDSLALTTQRTAATTSLAIDYLVPERSGKLAVIGSGPVALAHLAYEQASGPWDEISIFSPSLARDPARRDLIGKRFPEAFIADSACKAVAGAKTVMLCTSSSQAVIETGWLDSNVTVTSVSTNAPHAHEIDPAALSEFHVYCDYRATTPHQAGEMVIAQEDHGWSPEAILADLPELASGGAATGTGRRFFRSIGLGLEDVAAAYTLIELLEK